MRNNTGTVRQWNTAKGFGFIRPNNGGKDLFFHISKYGRDYKEPYEGLTVYYDDGVDKHGRKCAVGVTPVKGHKRPSVQSAQKIRAVLSTGVLTTCLALLYFLQKISIEVVLFYFVINVVTFIMYAKDKNAAQTGCWRTPESTLHLLSLLGGWAGAALAHGYLRHKSKKLSFRVVYWMTLVVNCTALYVWVTPHGRAILTDLIMMVK
ncbi:MAG: cold shock and DUF1294 domain-containing protein [Gammaproteobacteria bacterium]|nr:cold shock and DUF1294 domain-containing protein [Gammaproteobacteria bacterium]